MSVKVMSLRMPESLADDLAAVARTAGETTAEFIRIAIENEITARRCDPKFQAKRKQCLEKDVEALRRMGPPESN